jgi:hypothetical protein
MKLYTEKQPDEKVQDLIQLLARVEKKTRQQVADMMILEGLKHFHPFFAFYLEDGYDEIFYDEEKKKFRLVKSNSKKEEKSI